MIRPKNTKHGSRDKKSLNFKLELLLSGKIEI